MVAELTAAAGHVRASHRMRASANALGRSNGRLDADTRQRTRSNKKNLAVDRIAKDKARHKVTP
jgi:hypothetical protein